ncbi:serine/threonine-protein kinase [Streptosporangium saharense]|uniref:serine/threonine-protein kinase n=1 Tax=Streptosporangium saharense TaxID=1706840 RepID=UPI003321452B
MEVLDGRYELRSKFLPGGGMSSVWRAFDGCLSRPVVVKIIETAEKLAGYETSDATWYVGLTERMAREARTLARLSHVGLPVIHDLRGLDDGRPYMVMEFIEGKTVEELTESRSPLPADEVACLASQLCSVLAYVHEHGIFHRDLKPENLLVRPSGMLVLIDFGIALVPGFRGRRHTRALEPIMGTTGYIAPEVLDGTDRRGARADIYALGALLYWLLAGGPLFRGETDVVDRDTQHGDREPLCDRNSAVPAELGALVDSMVRRDPAERPGDMREVHERLAPWRRVEGFAGEVMAYSYDFRAPFAMPCGLPPVLPPTEDRPDLPAARLGSIPDLSSQIEDELMRIERKWDSGEREGVFEDFAEVLLRARSGNGGEFGDAVYRVWSEYAHYLFRAGHPEKALEMVNDMVAHFSKALDRHDERIRKLYERRDRYAGPGR